MPPLARFFRGAFVVALLLVVASCQRRRSGPPQLGLPGPMTIGVPPPPAAPPPAVHLRVPNLRVDLGWLDLEGFYPRGAQRVGPDRSSGIALLPAAHTAFPSAELCVSPDGTRVLFVDAAQRPRRIQHWLMLRERDSEAQRSLFTTATAFEVSWCPDSTAFAVTDFVGGNTSEVVVLQPAGGRAEIVLGPLLRDYFPSYLWEVPLFVKAYRWTPDNRLVVRALGRARAAPYEIIGCEALADFSAFSAPRLTFLRGYTKDADP